MPILQSAPQSALTPDSAFYIYPSVSDSRGMLIEKRDACSWIRRQPRHFVQSWSLPSPLPCVIFSAIGVSHPFFH